MHCERVARPRVGGGEWHRLRGLDLGGANHLVLLVANDVLPHLRSVPYDVVAVKDDFLTMGMPLGVTAGQLSVYVRFFWSGGSAGTGCPPGAASCRAPHHPFRLERHVPGNLRLAVLEVGVGRKHVHRLHAPAAEVNPELIVVGTEVDFPGNFLWPSCGSSRLVRRERSVKRCREREAVFTRGHPRVGDDCTFDARR